MRNIIATFTQAEQRIIVFVLVAVAAGCGILEWRESQSSRMAFSISDVAVAPHSAGTTTATGPDGLGVDGRICVNTADGPLLETLPGIGPSLASAILRHREAHGPFASMADLDKVPGIGPAMMTRLAPLVYFDGAAVATAARVEGQAGGMAVPGGGVVQPAGIVPMSITPGADRININTASAEELDALVGVGPALARRIIEDRQQRGPFRSPADLDRVKGIGPSILQKNAGMISTD